MKLKYFLKLGRLDKPVGIWLLWAPTAWALWIANQGHPSLKLAILFFLGTGVMRTAGCVINDIADRKIDLHIRRTKDRPITSAHLSVPEAFYFLIFLLSLALVLLIQLPINCFYYAPIALAIVIFYPFCKRFIKAPQFVLGIAFSLGIPMAYTASATPLNSTMFLLMFINLFWTIAYDTEYAMVDKEDDLVIGVKSTAIWFGRQDKLIIGLLQMLAHCLWLVLGFSLELSFWFFLVWLLTGLILCYQQWLLSKNAPQYAMQAFLTNGWYGLVLWFGLVIG